MVRFLTTAALVALGTLQFSVIAQDLKDIDPKIITDKRDTSLVVNFYSPESSQSIQFAPEWKEVVKLNKKSSAFGQINCDIYSDYCQDNGITRLPTIQAKLASGLVKEYVGDLNSKAIEEFVTSIQPKQRNTNGKNHEIKSSEELKSIVNSKEPWFVKFYAPWCGHCKNLAPVWEKLAANLKNQVNIAEVNCETNKALCKEYKISGLPTLSYFVHGANLKYNGERKLEKLTEYALKSSGSPILSLKSDKELDQVLKESDVNIVYVRKSEEKRGQISLLEHVAPKYLESIPFYTIADEETNARFNLEADRDLPATVIVKDGTFYVFGQKDIHNIDSWIQSEGRALIVRLGHHNANRVLRGQDTVVLGIFDSDDSESETKLRELSKIYQEKKKENNNQGLKDFVFARLDGKTFASYVGRAFGIQKEHMPAVIVSDPKNQAYYAKKADGNAFNLSEPFALVESILSLDKLESKSLKPPATVSIVNRIVLFFGDHWIIMTTVLVGFFGLLFWLMMENDPNAVQREQVLNNARQEAKKDSKNSPSPKPAVKKSKKI